MSEKIYISDYQCVTPLGFNIKENWQNLVRGKSGIEKHRISGHLPEVLASKITDLKIIAEFEKISDQKDFTWLEKMLILALKPIISNKKISEKTALILSTTKGNISLLKNPNTKSEDVLLSKTAQKIADSFGFATKPIVVSNACVSGVLSVSVAKNLINSGKFEDAFVIAADEISEFIVSGFTSFQAISSRPCKPYSAERDGISIGEAAAAVYISKNSEKNSFEICGDAAINDANHISGPSRTGEGLYRSVKNALAEAQISAKNIDFISAHGTATLYNDDMESVAFSRLGMENTPLNSLKGFYGHCLGAAGLLEIIVSMESAKRGLLIQSKNFETPGTVQKINVLTKNIQREINYFLKTASGFGGSNAAIILKKI